MRRSLWLVAQRAVSQASPKSRVTPRASAKAMEASALGMRSTEVPAAPPASKSRKNAGKLHFDASKAGLQLVDKAYVEQVIQEASKGSAFYQKEQRREEARRKKVAVILDKAAQYTHLGTAESQAIKDKVDEMEADLETMRDMERCYIHVDMDMFYAAVEEKKRPSLRGVPFGVGSNQMLSTTNYIARQYGVRSGMPGFIGRRLCPDLLIVPNDFASYRRHAAEVHGIAAHYDTHFVTLGLDELTMDVTDFLREHTDRTASQVASAFREEVFAKTQLTCSAGIAPTSTLAKIASNVNKPSGQHEVKVPTREELLAYVQTIALRKIPGIGYAQELTLNALGIKTCGDLLKHRYLLCYLFKEKTFAHYLAVGLGLEAHPPRQHDLRQSIGKESSFSEPLASPEALVKLFRQLLEHCHARCVRERLLAHQMRLILKYHSYDNEQFSVPLPSPTNDLKVWLEASHKLLEPHLAQYDEYRLVGIRMQKLVKEGNADSEADGAVEEAADLTMNVEDDDDATDEPAPIAAKRRDVHVTPVKPAKGTGKGKRVKRR